MPEETAKSDIPLMTMTDPIADMLTRLRNANQAYHDEVSMPFSKMKAGLAEILKQEGYITSFDVEGSRLRVREVGKTLIVTLKYGRNRERSIAGVRRISKPGLRVYAKATGLPKVLGGLGVAIISTTPGPPDRPPGQPEGRGRRSPRLRLVIRTTRPEGETSMSRIGRLPIPVPSGVDVAIDEATVTVKGPKGTLSHTVASPIVVEKGEDGVLSVNRPDDERKAARCTA